MAIEGLDDEESEGDFVVELLGEGPLGIMTRGEGGGSVRTTPGLPAPKTSSPEEIAATQAATKAAFDAAQAKVDAQSAARAAQQQAAVQLAVEQARATGGDVAQAEKDAITRSALETQDVINSGGDMTTIVVPSAQTPVQQLPAQQLNPWDQFWHDLLWGIDGAIKQGQTLIGGLFQKK